MQKKAVILFSGGIDSTTCLALAKSQGYACYALSFEYGQRHACELESAKQIAKQLDVIEHKILTLPLDQIGGSSLTDMNLTVPDYEGGPDIPTTYVPARNTIFLSLALAYAEVIGAFDIFYGANCVDYSHYPDCRPDFLRAFETLADLATKSAIIKQSSFRIHAPLIQMTKGDIIREGIKLGLDYSQSISCYRANIKGEACGRCDSCTYRKKGFQEANVPDPTPYY